MIFPPKLPFLEDYGRVPDEISVYWWVNRLLIEGFFDWLKKRRVLLGNGCIFEIMNYAPNWRSRRCFHLDGAWYQCRLALHRIRSSETGLVFDDSTEGKTRFATSCVLSSSCKVKTCPATKLNMIRTISLQRPGLKLIPQTRAQTLPVIVQDIFAEDSSHCSLSNPTLGLGSGRDLNIAISLLKSSNRLSLTVIDPILVLNP